MLRPLEKQIIFRKEVVDGILTYAQSNHPRESILLLKGKIGKTDIRVNELIIPPFAIHGHDFSSFPLDMLPSGLGVLAVAHSHPSGAVLPSTEDINFFYGRFMVIVGYPYESERDIGAFGRDGRVLKFRVE